MQMVRSSGNFLKLHVQFCRLDAIPDQTLAKTHGDQEASPDAKDLLEAEGYDMPVVSKN